MRHQRTLALLALIPLLWACGGHPGGSEHAAGHIDEVAWFDGDVEAAFALAEEQGKPLFLYWGAEWCPPCHYLKEKIFSHPDFIEKSREFVTLYLDGDTERAQIYGEKFGTLGYPTVIVFNPGGEEILRLPSDVGVARYVALMNGALRRMEPISQVMADVMEAGPASAEPGDLNALAFCSWGTIEGLDDEGQKEAAARLYRETPDSLPVEKSRFFTTLLGSELELLDAEEEGVGPTDAERDAYRREMDVLLADPALRNANLFFLFYWAAETAELLHPEPSRERDRLMDGWVKAMHQIEADETLSVSDRLSAAFALIALAQLEVGEEGTLPAELVSHVRARVAWAAENASGEREMQSVMNNMAHLMADVHLEEELESLLMERMDEALAPYYFMSWIAGLKEDADQAEEALSWYRKAYDAAEGRYSRFRWGSGYLRHLMDLAPEDTATLESASREVLTELLEHEDAFAGGNRSRLGQLENAYRDWNEDGSHDELVVSIGGLVREECGRYPEDGEDSQQSRCLAFLSDDSAEG